MDDHDCERCRRREAHINYLNELVGTLSRRFDDKELRQAARDASVASGVAFTSIRLR